MKKFLLLAFWALTLYHLPAQTTISGYLTDAQSGEPLLSATVLEVATGKGALANTYGFYSLTLPAGRDSATLRFSYIGYQTQEKRVALRGDETINVALGASVDLQTIEVSSDRGERIEQQTQMSRTEIPVAQIKRIPALLGEVDVLKTLQLLPGVQSGGEGATGLYVRGGSPDQNLVLLDGVPIYNVSHVLGIFSVFNADALRSVTLTKGGFPARFGGRLSSVLEINMKEGNLNEWEGEGSLGLISSKLTLSGPIKKGRTSILLSGRRTYVDLIARPLIKRSAADGTDVDLKLHFYDLNGKLQHKIDDKNRLFLSFYSGADVFGTEVEDMDQTFGGGTDWGNIVTSARWNREISPKLFLNTTATYSKYDINIDALSDDGLDDFRARYVSGIYDFGGKVDFDFIPNPEHYVRFGGGWTNHTYRPGAVSLRAENDGEVNLDTLIGSQVDYSNEFALYAEDDFRLGDRLKVNAGLHFSAFAVNDEFYTSLQPRLGLRYLLDNDVSLKAGFSTMQQYINLLTSESLSLPTDLWVPSTDRVLPQESWQIAAGAAKTLNDEYEVSVEAYYKQMKNVISFREGASFFLGVEDDWEDKVTQGDGEAYGLELFVQKKQGRLTGWVGYTLSWNWRQFDEINSGERFPFRYDRRHDLSVVGNYDISDKVWLSGAFVYGTGNAVSLPTYRYATVERDQRRFSFGGDFVEAGVNKNSFRMTNYHRLDLSISFRKQKKRYLRTWVIGAYNAYWHKNPYFLTTDDVNVCDDNNRCQSERRVREINILPFIPSVAYQFKF